MYFQIVCYVLERLIRTQHQILLGNDSWIGSKIHHNTEFWPQLRENRWNSSGIFPRIHHIVARRQSPRHLCLYFQKDFQQDVGHSSDLGRKNGILLTSSIDHEENGTESLNWWWSNSEKADTQFSEPRVHCPEERSKAKEVGNYQYTSAPMEIRLKVLLAQLFLLISSVSTEQSQICVRNTVLVKQERRDPCWQDNLIQCSSQQDCWWQHRHLRLKFLHKKINYKSTKNEWKGFHNKIEW